MKLLASVLAVSAIAGCSTSKQTEPLEAKTAAAPPVAPSATMVASPAPTPAPSATPAPPPVAPAPKAGFVATVDGKPWSAGPVRLTATLADSMSNEMPGMPKGVTFPRSLSLDVERPEDGARIALHIDVVDRLVGKHACVCNKDTCSNDFQAHFYPPKGKPLFIAEPSALEVVAFEDAGPDKKRISVRFDITVREAPGKKPVRVVGTLENAEVLDIGKPVGLLHSGGAPLEPLGVDCLPTNLRAK